MPMSALLNIAVAEPSAIIRSGLEAVLKRIPGFRIQIIEIATAELLQDVPTHDIAAALGKRIPCSKHQRIIIEWCARGNPAIRIGKYRSEA